MRRVLLAGVLVASSRVLAQPAPPEGTGSASAPSDATGSATEHVDPKPSPEPAPGPRAVTPPPGPRAVTPPPKPAGTATDQRIDAERACAAHHTDCDWLATFSSLEKQSVERALAARALEIDPQPWGKPIARVLVYNENVFAEKNWLRFFNFIHYTTRESAIREELPVHAGDVWDDDRVAESARILHDPLYSSVVALLPIKSSEPGKVDLLVVTRDVWSLRFNTQYTYQQGSLTNLSISISENNFLGHRNVLSAAALMDQGSLALGPLFIDKNFLGKHLDFRARVDEILTRQSLDVVSPSSVHTPTGDPKGWEDGGGYRNEGHDATISLSRPLWSLETEWGGGAAFSLSNAIARSYFGTGIRSYDDPDTAQVETVAREFRYQTWSIGANATRQWGTVLKQQLNFGYSVSSQHPELLPNFSPDPMLRADFIRDVFPHDEVISQSYIEYSFFQPKYRTLRNFGTYALAEDVRLGPAFDVTIAQALSPLGSTHTFTRPSMSGGWTLPWGRDGFVHPSAGFSMRIQPTGSHDTIDNTAQVSLGAATPMLRWFRVVASASLETRWHETQNAYYTIGSDSGLRGYPINAFYGQRRAATSIELRTLPVPWWVFRVGAVAFYENGGAANSVEEIRLYHDVGFGIRALIPQTSRELLRIDVALPLVASPGNPISPHILAGFGSYF